MEMHDSINKKLTDTHSHTKFYLGMEWRITNGNGAAAQFLRAAIHFVCVRRRRCDGSNGLLFVIGTAVAENLICVDCR